MTHYLAIDFGGTRIRAALFDDKNQLLHREETLTRATDGQNAIIQRLIETGQSVLSGNVDLQAVGMAAPGPLDARTGVIHHAKTLPGWQNVALAAMLKKAFGVPVFIQNDGNLGALAEYHLGAGQGADPMLYLTISTGIGGGAIINGQLFTGANALAIEPGHMRLTLRDGSHRRLEELASGTALGNQAKKYLRDNNLSSILRDVGEIDGKAVGEAARAGDALALRVVNEAAHALGLGLINLIHLFNPEAIVLGGSVIQLDDLMLSPVKKLICDFVLHEDFFDETIIRKAAIEEDMCLYGAMLHAKTCIIHTEM